MEEIRETAKAYYNNLTEEKKSEAKKMFVSMDLNGDGSVSMSEYVKVMGEKGFKSSIKETFFEKLDKDGDGMLDFEEFTSFYYLYKSIRLVFCDGHECGAFLNGVYFTCVHCFKKSPPVSFDLCSSCFSNKSYSHDHSTFLDNYMLLRSMQASNKFQKDIGEAGAFEAAGEVFEAAADVADVLGNDCDCDCDCGCSIM